MTWHWVKIFFLPFDQVWCWCFIAFLFCSWHYTAPEFLVYLKMIFISVEFLILFMYRCLHSIELSVFSCTSLSFLKRIILNYLLYNSLISISLGMLTRNLFSSLGLSWFLDFFMFFWILHHYLFIWRSSHSSRLYSLTLRQKYLISTVGILQFAQNCLWMQSFYISFST